MKIFLTVLVFVFIFTSCKQDEILFSCDPILNEYVAANQAQLKQIKINELASSGLDFQKAVFRSFDAAKKRDVWLEKIQILLETQEYTKDEYNHVEKLINHILLDYFKPENLGSQNKERIDFATHWIEYAKDNLGWSDQDVAFVVYRLYTNREQFQSELNVLKSLHLQTSANSEGGTCNCNVSSSFCPNSCNGGNCGISGGCGWLWSEACDGICY